MQEKTLTKPRNTTSNIHSSEIGSVSYDIFGSPYQKSGSFLADDSLDFGYLGKPYNADTELYDYGFRDYSPEIARFSTVAPIRDGRNWYCYVVNDPVNYVDLWGLQCKSESDGENKGVDYKFIAKHEGTQQLTGYVPTNKDGSVIGRSGVTIATGFDIGQHNSYDLNRIFGKDDTNKDLKELYTPYLDKRKQDALNILKEKPLKITQDQADRTDAAVYSHKLESVKKMYNDESKDYNGDFDNLPSNAQTAIFSFAYQNGTGAVPSDLVEKLANGDYSGAADILIKYGQDNGYSNRRNDEAKLLQELSKQKNSTAN